MNVAESSSQQNNQINERINTLKNEIHEKIAVNEGRILLGNAINLGAAPVGINLKKISSFLFIRKFKLDLIKGLGVAAGAMGAVANATVLGGVGALVVGGVRFKLNLNNTRNSRFTTDAYTG